MSKPVGVIIACHNPKRPLQRAVASVLDGSGDVADLTVVAHNTNVDELTRTVSTKYRDRVRWLELSDGIASPTGPFSLGLAEARSTWVSIMGADDFLDPGAVASWLRLSEGRDAVIAKVRYDDGKAMRTPPARPFRPQGWRRNVVKDRLYYRSAPLGLMRVAFLRSRNLRLDPGLGNGEDLNLSSALWTLGRVAVQRRGPSYRVGQSADDRVTMRIVPARDTLASVGAVWNGPLIPTLSPTQRTALGTKFLRIHIFGFAYYRALTEQWLPGDRESVAQSIEVILTQAPRAPRSLSIADRKLLDALMNPSVPETAVNELALGRRRFGSLSTLITREPLAVLDRDAPLRLMAASALV